MTTQISVETLSPITHNQIPVITTELLAQLYGAEINNIQQNFKRNAGRFVAGKHFFKLEGNDLRDFKNRLTDSQSVAKHSRSLILWTERGAARHAKMLETDQAWEVFEKLEDSYFRQDLPTAEATPAIDLMNIDVHLCIRDGKVAFIHEIRQDQYVASVDEILGMLKLKGWVTMPKDELAEKLMSL